MFTTKFTIEPYLAEYLKGKWAIEDAEGNLTNVVQIPEKCYLYDALSSLIIKKPNQAPNPTGNIEIVVPHRREGNRRPEHYNYISERAAAIMNKKIKLFFRADLHEFIDHHKHDNGETYSDACFLFITKYSITSIDPDSLTKNYFRWKSDVRQNRNKKSYTTR